MTVVPPTTLVATAVAVTLPLAVPPTVRLPVFKVTVPLNVVGLVALPALRDSEAVLLPSISKGPLKVFAPLKVVEPELLKVTPAPPTVPNVWLPDTLLSTPVSVTCRPCV